MLGSYNIYLDNAVVGTVDVSQQGLYYKFHGICTLPKGMYRLFAVFEKTKCDLGICVPFGKDCVVEKTVPIKQLHDGKVTFCIMSAGQKQVRIVPVFSERPFAYLLLLNKAKLQVIGDRYEIQIES